MVPAFQLNIKNLEMSRQCITSFNDVLSAASIIARS
jgi:hypothetical protein